jgi:RHS repeat-associated protein
VYYDGAYAPFGQAYAQSGTTDLNFTGMDQHIVSGLYDFPAREYNGLEGRWPSPDPAGLAAVNPADPQTWNRYAYVRNNPLGLSDRTGMYIGGPRCAAMSGKRIPRAAEMCGGCYDNSDWNCIAGGSEGLSAPGDMGYTIFDAIQGAPGTYFNLTPNGPSWGFSIPAWYSAMAAIDAQANYLSQANGQYDRLNGNLQEQCGVVGCSADPSNCLLIGGHCNFSLDCPDWTICGPGRYDNGIHIECASGGYDCSSGDSLVVHDDTVSPWVGPFTLGAIFTANFWEHGFVDLIGGSLVVGAFPH